MVEGGREPRNVAGFQLLGKAGKEGLLPWILQKEHSPVQLFIQWDPFQTFDLQDCKVEGKSVLF